MSNPNVQQPQQQQPQQACCCYPGEDKFMHFFELKSPAQSFLGLPLVWGVRILAFIFLFFDVFGLIASGSIIGFIVTCFETFANGALLYASIYNSYKWGFIGYFINMIFFYINIVFGIFIALVILAFYLNLKIFLLFLLIFILFAALKLAIMWIFYSYILTIKSSPPQQNIEMSHQNPVNQQGTVNNVDVTKN